MSDFNVLKEYYIRYLKQVRGNSDSSVNHYIVALQTISKYLVERGKIANTIYEIDNVGELEIIRGYLYQQPDFVEKNERGRRMYSAGLNNYIRFAEGMEFAEAGERATVLDFAVPVEKNVCVETMEWRRNRIIKKQALEFAQYKCEVDSGHITFIAAATMKPYMEGHHAVPMKEQNNFEVSLDVYANIVCLCPICHRLLHYGKVSQKREALTPNKIEDADKILKGGDPGDFGYEIGNPVQITRCPHCGAPITAENYSCNKRESRMLIKCSSEKCEFKNGFNSRLRIWVRCFIISRI